MEIQSKQDWLTSSYFCLFAVKGVPICSVPAQWISTIWNQEISVQILEMSWSPSNFPSCWIAFGISLSSRWVSLRSTASTIDRGHPFATHSAWTFDVKYCLAIDIPVSVSIQFEPAILSRNFEMLNRARFGDQYHQRHLSASTRGWEIPYAEDWRAILAIFCLA